MGYGKHILLAGVALALHACTSVPKDAGFSDVKQLVSARLDKQVQWNQGSQDDATVAERVRQMLQSTLTIDEAVQIALINNHNLQAIYENLGIAQADLVQAGLLENPIFSMFIRPKNNDSGVNREFAIVQNFLSILTVSARKRISEAAFEQTKLEVAKAVLDLAFEVKATYYKVEADEQALELFRQVSDATEAAAELASRQYEAGTLSRRGQAVQQAFHAQTLLDIARTQAQIAADREKLNRLMGLWSAADTAWVLPHRLPDAPASLPDIKDLEASALNQRLDLAAVKKEAETRAKALGLTRDYRLLDLLAAGISTEHDADGGTVTGPVLGISVPLFDQGQARVSRDEYRLRQVEDRLVAMVTDVRSEVREAHYRMAVVHETTLRYRKTLLPLQQEVTAQTQLFYNGMLVGVYDLLLAKQNEINAARNYIAATRDFWIARAELERTLGGSLPSMGNPPQAAPQAEKALTSESHAH